MRTRYFKLVDGEPVPAPELDLLIDFKEAVNVDEVARFIESRADVLREVWSEAHRRVALTRIRGVEVSTVFLVVDHSFSYDGTRPPVLFETMVFGGWYDELTMRYCTRLEALEGHAQITALVVASRHVPKWLQTATRVSYDFVRSLPWRLRGYRKDAAALWANRQKLPHYARRYLRIALYISLRTLKHLRKRRP